MDNLAPVDSANDVPRKSDVPDVRVSQTEPSVGLVPGQTVWISW